MNKIRLFQVLSLLMVVTMFSCSKEDAPYQEDDKFYTVSLNFIGDITTADSPLTRGTATDDLYGLMVWEDNTLFGCGLYDNIEDMKLRLQASKKYSFVVTAVKNGKEVLSCNSSNKFGAPFNSELTNSVGFVNILKVFEPHGEMSEWLKEPVLKTGDVKASVGSNPTLSAIFLRPN